MFNLIEDIQKSHGIFANPNNQKETSLITIQDGQPISSYGDPATLNRVYENLEYVYRSVYLIATAIASLPRKVYVKKKDASDDLDITNLYPVFNSPNKIQSAFDFWNESISRFLLQGELFWEMTLSPSKEPIQLFADWRSEEVEIIGDPETLYKEFVRTVNGKKFHFRPDEVFFTKNFNPYDSLRGLPPLRAARQSLEMDFNAINFNKSFFSQGMKMSGILQTPQELEEKIAQRLKKDFEKLYSGQHNAHKVAVLHSGLSFTALNSMSLSDAQFSELRTTDRENICMIFGVPPEMLGIGNMTYENVKYARRKFYTETVMPEAARITSLINTFLLTRFKSVKTSLDTYFKFDFSNVEALKEDRTAKVKDYQIGIQLGALTLNEMRVDVFGKSRFSNKAFDEPIILNDKRIEKHLGYGQTEHKLYAIDANVESRDKTWHERVKTIDPLESDFVQIMEKFFKEQKREVVENIKKQNAKSNIQMDGIIFDVSKWEIILESDTEDEVKYVTSLFGQQVLDSYASGKKIDMAMPSVRNEIGRRVQNLSRFTNSTTNDRIKKLLEEAEADQLSVAQKAEKIALWFDEVSPVRAARIARTESYGASNFGILEGTRQAGLDGKMWITSRDERVRESHLIDGQVVGVDEDFTLNDGSMVQYPQAINERCVLSPYKLSGQTIA